METSSSKEYWGMQIQKTAAYRELHPHLLPPHSRGRKFFGSFPPRGERGLLKAERVSQKSCVSTYRVCVKG